MTLFYSTPLVLTGLAVAIPFQAGLFNIGAEGQLAVGALAAAAVGVLFPHVPWPLAPVLAALADICGRFPLGRDPGLSSSQARKPRSHRYDHVEFCRGWFDELGDALSVEKSRFAKSRTAHVGASYLIERLPWFDDAPVSWGLLVAPIVAGLVWVWL